MTEPQPISVTAFRLPHGEQEVGYFRRSAEISDLAHRIIDAGYRFTLERLTTGEISMCVESDDCDEDIEIVPNKPEVVREGFDRLVKRAARLARGEG